MMNKISVLALIIASAALLISFTQSQKSNPVQETSFERIVRTETIRCGYAVAYPELIKDPVTKKLSGYDYDVANAIGDALGLKVEWVEEVGWGAVEQGLKTKRYDMACNSFWAHPPRAKAAVFSTPIVYHPLFPVVRGTLEGPKDNYSWLNDPKYKMLILDGTIGNLIAANYFPSAKVVDAAVIASEGDFFLNLAMGKADFSFSSLSMIKLFNEQNPGKIKILPVEIEVTNGALLLPNDDWRTKQMVDKAIAYLLDSGRIKEIMTHHMGNDSRLWRLPAQSYR
ncbi:MAG: substrate-binding periplasmic protein [Bdellovibrionales bacterium]